MIVDLPTTANPVSIIEDDCLEVLKRIPDASISAVVTDPPYGINTKSAGNRKISPWPDLCNAAYWYVAWLRECRRVLDSTGSLWTCLNWRSLPTFQKASCDLKWPIESLMVWDKDWISTSHIKALRPRYEMVALFAMPDFVIKDRSIPDIQCFPWSAYKPNGHPAEKPVDLMRFCINVGASSGGLVLDPFAGSGTTLVAAVLEGRRAIGIECNPAYAEIARRRVAAALGAASLFAEAGG